MASNFVPMLSSSPPPLDDCPDDDDDEFGNFTSANIPFDSSFDSPVSTNKHKSYKSGDNGVNDVSLNNDFNTFCSFTDSPSQNHVHDISVKNKVYQAQTNKPENDNLKNEVSSDFSNNSFSADFDFKPKWENSVDSNRTQNSIPDVSKPIQDESENCECDTTLKTEIINSELPNCSTISNSQTTVIQEQISLDTVNDDENSSSSITDLTIKTSNLRKESFSTLTNNFQDDDVKPCGLFNNCDVVNCDEMQSNDINSTFEVENEVMENLEFPVDFESTDDFGDFDEFQQADGIIYKENESQNIIHNEASDTFQTNFNSYQQSVSVNPECDDDFDDFQTFSDTNATCNSKNVHNECSESKDLSDDEEFESFKKSEVPEVEAEDFDDFKGCFVAEASATPNFANFESSSFDQAHSESPEFADFESASFSSVSDETPPTFACASSPAVQDKKADKISTVMKAIFPLPSDYNEEESCELLSEHSEILEQSNKSLRLWEKLHEVEQTPGSRFQWGISHTFQQLLRSVNVDYHSILRTSSVPIFASSLSLLEPVKGQISAANAESEDKSQSPRLQDPIPPVEFDWTSSGLVNPLDQAASTLMDLSFLATADTATSSSSNDHSFENELLKPSPNPTSSESTNKTFILEELLSKNVCSLPNSKTAHRPSNISQEANSVLDQLPDLSFMRAKVLMFPISNKT